MLLQVLGTLEGLSAEVALVRLERNVHANVRGNVIAFHSCGSARVPLASQVEVVGTLPANMALTDVVLVLRSDFRFVSCGKVSQQIGLHKASRQR